MTGNFWGPLAVKIVHHHANGRFDWLISEHQSVNPSREAISILSGKYRRLAAFILKTSLTADELNE